MVSITDTHECFLKIYISFCRKTNGPLSEEISNDGGWCQMFHRKAESPHDATNHKNLKHREKSFLTLGADQSQVLQQKDHYHWQNFILASLAVNTIFPYKLS
jgi:hypothetical protein